MTKVGHVAESRAVPTLVLAGETFPSRGNFALFGVNFVQRDLLSMDLVHARRRRCCD